MLRRKADNSIEDRTPPLSPATGATADGVPLAFNRAPDAHLRDWVGRSMVAVAHGSDATVLQGLLCNDASYLRSAVAIDWVARTADGPMPIRDMTFLCGQHSEAMSLDYTGGIQVAGLMLRPGALRALFGLSERELVERTVPVEAVNIPDREVTGIHASNSTPAQWLKGIEDWLVDFIARKSPEPPHPISRALEFQSFADPNRTVGEFAEEQGVSQRTVERRARLDFGLSAKQILRRARVLDSAARLCGVADEEEAEDILLRFFDQAHQIREFRNFFGMTPREFRLRRSGLLTLSLEIRQARRLEMLDRLQANAIRPWMREPLQQV